MRNIIRAARVVLLVAGGIFTNMSSQAQSFLTNGLVAYYPFNGNANDASGNRNNGVVYGATLTTDRFGNANQAYSFNGSSSYISIASVPLQQTDNWTMSAWLNPAAINQDAMAVCLGYDNGETANGFEFGIGGGNDALGNELFGILGNVAWIGSGYAFGTTNVWYQVVMLRRSGTNFFYVNGTQTANDSALVPLTPSAFTIGSGSGIRYFNGAIDDVRVYNRAFSTNEVAQLYLAEAAPFIGLAYAVKPTFSGLLAGTNYQLQISTNLAGAFTNYGSPFNATNGSMVYPQYFDVANWGQLFFRVKTSP